MRFKHKVQFPALLIAVIFTQTACDMLGLGVSKEEKERAAFEAKHKINTSEAAIYIKAVKKEMTDEGCRMTLLMQNQLDRAISSSDLRFKLDEYKQTFGPPLGGDLGAGELMFRSDLIYGVKQCPNKLTIWTVDGKGEEVFVNTDIAKFEIGGMSAKIVEAESLSGS